jgi:hypothetical protein
MKKHEQGQALIELIIFLPLMFMLYAVIAGFANAINGSINQQKITRAYFYYRLQNNSTIPKPDPDQSWQNWQKFGMFFIGWKERFQNQSPLAPCYKISLPLQAASGDNCEEKYSNSTTQYIRVGTVYGICGATYGVLAQSVAPILDIPGGNFDSVVNKSSCLIQ